MHCSQGSQGTVPSLHGNHDRSTVRPTLLPALFPQELAERPDAGPHYHADHGPLPHAPSPRDPRGQLPVREWSVREVPACSSGGPL